MGGGGVEEEEESELDSMSWSEGDMDGVRSEYDALPGDGASKPVQRRGAPAAEGQVEEPGRSKDTKGD
jgi:hypothetical protein